MQLTVSNSLICMSSNEHSIKVCFLVPRSEAAVGPPPLPAKPKTSNFSQLANDSSATYVQPQSILPPSLRQQNSPSHIIQPVKAYANIESKLPYATIRDNISNKSISSSYELQKPPNYLSQVVSKGHGILHKITITNITFIEILETRATPTTTTTADLFGRNECFHESQLHRRFEF